MKPCAYGVDIGGTAIKLGLFQTDGKLLEKWQIPTRIEGNGQNILPDALNSIRENMVRWDIRWGAIEGVGIGVPGPVGEDGTVYGCVNLGWNTFGLPRQIVTLEPAIHKVRVSNDVNAATLGELWKGGAQGHRSVFMVTLGTGIGGGLVIGERIINGIDGGAGEIGHFCVNPDEPEQCKCGSHGCLEQYCSATGLARCAKKVWPEKNLSAKAVCDLAKAGDSEALALLEQLGQKLGWALTAAAGTVNPEVFVIGGGLSNAGEILVEKIQFYYQKYAFHAFRDTPFVLAKLGNDAGIYGCVRMLM